MWKELATTEFRSECYMVDQDEEEEREIPVEVVVRHGGGHERGHGGLLQWVGMSGRGHLRRPRAFCYCSARERVSPL